MFYAIHNKKDKTFILLPMSFENETKDYMEKNKLEISEWELYGSMNNVYVFLNWDGDKNESSN